jgi:hypothetical protein
VGAQPITPPAEHRLLSDGVLAFVEITVQLAEPVGGWVLVCPQGRRSQALPS